MSRDGPARLVTVPGARSDRPVARNGLVLDDARVSRHHARLRARHGMLVLTDLGSTNGGRVNGVRVDEVVLGVGDRIELGDTVLVVDAAAPGDGSRRPRRSGWSGSCSWAALPLPAGVVRVLLRDLRSAAREPVTALGRLLVVASERRADRAGRLPLDAIATLGRDVNNTIVVDDPFVRPSTPR